MSNGAETALTLGDLERLARRRVPRFVMDFVDGGADTESAVERNLAAFREMRIVPRYLQDCSAAGMETTLFGRTWSMPLGIAPTGLVGLVHTKGDVARARAARAAGVPFVLSAAGTDTIEDVANAAPGHVWFQLYPLQDRKIGGDLLARAARANIDTLVVTVDVPAEARKLRDMRNGFAMPVRFSARTLADIVLHPRWALAMARSGTPSIANFAPYATDQSTAASLAVFIASMMGSRFDWAELAQVRRAWSGRLVVKGLMHPEDVSRAVATGADGVIVSNHGGRQFDAAPAAVDMLPACLDAAGGKIPLMLDGGVRHGLDILRARAAGAAFVFVGRPSIHALAAAGEAGVDRMFTILRDELRRGLIQGGVPDLAALDASALRR